MTRDDEIRMAKEILFLAENNELGLEDLARFAALVAAAEREACAQVAERMLRYYTQAVTGVPETIRARGKG